MCVCVYGGSGICGLLSDLRDYIKDQRCLDLQLMDLVDGILVMY